MNNSDTLQSLLTHLSGQGNKECLLELHPEGITRWSCADVAQTAERLARGLVAAGVNPGDYIPILATNRAEWPMAALAILGAGAAVSPLDTQIKSEALGRILVDSQARFIFTTTDYVNRLRQLDPQGQLRPILFDVGADDERGWSALLTDDPTVALPAVTPDDPAALFYTSGTTGVPKGVPLTHRNLVFQIESVKAVDLVQPDDRILLPLPMYHVYPFTVGTLIPLAFGVPIILPQSLTGPQIIRALQEGEVTIVIGVPRVYRAVYDGIEAQVAAQGKVALKAFQASLATSIRLRQRFGSQVGQLMFGPIRSRIGPNLRLLASGGSALAPDLAWKLEGLGWQVAIGYGLTETAPMLTMNLPTAGIPKLGSVGPALPGIELRLAPTDAADDEAGSAAHPAGEGEILARGPSVFTGYRQLPEQTAQAFTDDGWFRTGDLGYFDDGGHLYISGRASTLIVTEGGKNIQPEPVEEIYQSHTFIREIGILADDNKLVALIVPEIEEINWHRNGDVERAIREAVNEQVQAVASYQRLNDYAVTDVPLPRTNLGKIQRHTLADYYHQAKAGAIQTTPEQSTPLAIADMAEKDQLLLADPLAHQVWNWLAERYADRRLTLDSSPQLDLGIDSMEWLTLTLELSERTGVELSDEAIGRITNIRDLLQEVEDAAEAGVTSQGNPLEDPEAWLTDEQKKWLTPRTMVFELLGALLFFPMRLIARLYFRLTAYGLENLPRQGNYILTPNHVSFLDAPMIAATLPYSLTRQFYWAASTQTLFSNWIVRSISWIFQAVPIEHQRSGAGIRNLALAAAILKRHKNLVWFPEGNITRTEGLLPFQEGIGLILEAVPTTVVPVYIKGAREALPRGDWWPKSAAITITFGQPCDPRELAEQGQGENGPTRMAQALQDKVVALGQPPVQTSLPAPSRSLAGRAIIEALAIVLTLGLAWLVMRRIQPK
ncbi:MAG: AMP-binding protein [Anaerolineae bacterium]|nr:AMP-binding protein [Anaerolineae bacterium]